MPQKSFFVTKEWSSLKAFLQDSSICVYLFAILSVVMVVTITLSDCFFDSLDVAYAEKGRLGHLKWNFRLIINHSVHQQSLAVYGCGHTHSNAPSRTLLLVGVF